MTLDVGSNEINSAIAKDSLNTSIFINGNLARVLLASHRITGDATHLDEGLKWCDTLVSRGCPRPRTTAQRGSTGGRRWNTARADLFVADTGTSGRDPRAVRQPRDRYLAQGQVHGRAHALVDL